MSSVYWTHHHDPRSTTRDEGACALLDRRAGRSRDQACRLDIYRDTTTLTPAATVSMSRRPGLGAWALLGLIVLGAEDDQAQQRSEEHTSELQSLAYLVCRLLLE